MQQLQKHLVNAVYVNEVNIGNTPTAYTFEQGQTYYIVYKQNNTVVFSKELKVNNKKSVTFNISDGRPFYTNIITEEITYL